MSLDCETIERSESLPVGTHSLSVAGTPVTALHAPTAPKAASPRGRALCAGSALWVSFAARGFGSHDRGAWGSQHLNGPPWRGSRRVSGPCGCAQHPHHTYYAAILLRRMNHDIILKNLYNSNTEFKYNAQCAVRVTRARNDKRAFSPIWKSGVLACQTRALDADCGWVRRVGIAVASARLVSPPNAAIPGRDICCAGFMKRSLPPSTPYPTRRVCTPCRRLWISLGQIQNLPWPDSSTASLALSPFPLAPHGCFLTAALDALVECV